MQWHSRARMEEDRRRFKQELERVRRAHKEASELSEVLERDVEEGFNRYWGLLFKDRETVTRRDQRAWASLASVFCVSGRW